MIRNRALGAVLSVTMLASLAPAYISVSAADDVKYKETPRIMEELNRGLIAVYTTADTREQTKNGVVLSWRLLGKESLSNQAFDIYRDGKKIHTTGVHDPTYYFDSAGTASNKYKVVKTGATDAEVAAEKEVTPSTTFSYAKPSEVGNGNSHKHSFTYVDIPISMPTDIPHANSTKLSDYKRNSKGAGGANDASIGDLDGDGDYEIVLKWDPNDSRDAAGTTTTGDCILDAYEIDPNNNGYKWRIDLGQNITSGAHSTQFMVYDFDHDGKAEIATQTAEGSYSLVKKGDGTWEKIYVTTVGDTPEIQNGDNSATHLSKGKNVGADYLTIFDGETGRPLKTTAGIPLGSPNGSDWGDSELNRSSRYLAAVAYLDGVNPYYIAIRGMYNRTVIRAYSWDGETFKLEKEHIGDKKGSTMYGEGNHNLSVSDIDNDGKDEIVYGSACLDDDFKTVLGNTQLGHGDAMHVSDFNNDGIQEVFSVKEDKEGFKQGTQLRVAKTGETVWSKAITGDNGRGLMGNIDDTYAAAHPEALSLGWAAAHEEAFDLKGNAVNAKPASAGKGDFCNFLVYWDGDLSSELLDANIIQKYDAANGWTKRFYGPSDGYTLSGQTNNDSKRNYTLVADLWGDWREEIIMPVDDSTPDAPKLRIFTSLVPTDYRLTTLMHDSQYRCAIAWQNVGYNQPPHTSYYIGSASLAKSGGSTLNYLAPAVPFDKIIYPSDIPNVPVEDIDMRGEDGEPAKDISLERSKTYTFTASVTPGTATKKGIKWTSSAPDIATVDGGIVKAVGANGEATITATSSGNPDVSKSVKVNVFSTPVTGVSITPDTDVIKLTVGDERTLAAAIEPAGASDKSVEWRSTNPGAATVDKNGKVTAVAMGLATIFVKTIDGGFEDSVTVNVLPETAENKAGDNAFTLQTGDASGTFTSTATSASLVQEDNANDAVFYKTVQDAATDKKAKLSFRFTTGGTKINGSAWDWKGHEFSAYVKLLGKNGENILTFHQPWNSVSGNEVKAGTLTTQAGNDSAQNFPDGWTPVIDVSGNISGSAKRWQVDIDFDYPNNKADAVIYGYDTGFANITAQYTKSFSLNPGVILNKLEFSSHKEGTGGIYWQPIVEALSYVQLVPTDGATSDLYKRGEKTGIPWSADDISAAKGGFEVTGGQELMYDDVNKRIWFNPTKPAASYSASKTFDVSDNALLVEYDLDWYFGSSVGEKREHSEYVQIGDKIRFGWKKDYKVYLSKDGGVTWESASLFDGSNKTFTKNIHLVYDKKNKTVKSLTFDGKDVMTNESFDDAMNKVTFGLNRITDSAAENWSYPCGLDNISVSQFAEGGMPQQYDINISSVSDDGTTVTAAFAAADASNLIIGALYDGDTLVEVETVQASASDGFVPGAACETELTFANDVNAHTLKLFMWDSLDGAKPIVSKTAVRLPN